MAGTGDGIGCPDMNEAARLVLAGHVTCDEVGGATRLGGPASYCGLAAVRLGVPAAIVSGAPPEQPLLRPLREAGLRLQVVPDGVMTTFGLHQTGGQRTLFLKARARSLPVEDVPAALRGAPVAFVGPVSAECDRAFIDGCVVPALASESLYLPPVGAALLSEHDHPFAEVFARRGAAGGAGGASAR